MFKAFITAMLLACAPAWATLNDVDKTQIYNKNLLSNGGFEHGKVSWTASAGTYAVTTSSPMVGKVHATWDAAASADTLTSTAVSIPAGMYGRNAVFSCLITTASGTATHTIQAYDGSNILASTTITSSTSPVRTSVNFIMPSSGSIYGRLYANADEPSIAIDDCYLGPAEGYNIGSVSQAVFVGRAYYASTASCAWSLTSTSFSDFSTTAACPSPTVSSNPGPGTILTTDADLPQITVTNLPPGIYRVEANVSVAQSGVASYSRVRLSDGTNTSPAHMYNSSNTTFEHVSVVGMFTYSSTQSSVTFKLQGASTSGTTNISNDASVSGGETVFTIYRFPLSSEQAYKPDMLAQSWSGYHDNTCSWARNSTSYGSFTADATCSLTERTNSNFGTVSTSGSVLPAITFTPKKAGRYYVCATFPQIGTAEITSNYRLYDGSTTIAEVTTVPSGTQKISTELCGIYVVSNTSAKTIELQGASNAGTITVAAGAVGNSSLEWSIFALDNQLPAPAIVNSVVNSQSAVTGIEIGQINCDGASAITSQVGSWISSVGNISAGACAITLKSNIFSSAPHCIVQGAGLTTPNTAFSITAASATSVTVDCAVTTTAADCTSADFNIMCMGPR